MATTNPADYNKKDGLPSIAAAMNQGANPTAKGLSSTQEAIAKMGIGYANPPVGLAMTAADVVNTIQGVGQAGGPAFTQDPLGNLSQTAETMVSRNPVTSGIAKFFGFTPEDKTIITDPANRPMTIEQRYASNAAALADYNARRSGNAGIDALNKASGNIGRLDYQGAPISEPPATSLERADIYGNITQAAQQSLARNAGNMAAPVPQSSITTTPSIAGSVAKAGQATTPTSPSGMSLPTSKPSMPGATGINLGNIPGISSDIANMRLDLSPIANQISQATGAGDPSVGSGVPTTGSGTVISGTGIGRLDYQGAPIGGDGADIGGDVDPGDFSVDNSSAADFSEEGLRYGGMVKREVGGTVQPTLDDRLKDLMRGYF